MRMNEKQYYELIEEYNRLVNDKKFNPEYFTQDKQERFTKLRELLLYEVRYFKSMQKALAMKGYSVEKRKVSLNKFDVLENQLEEGEELEKTSYENSWFEEVYFGYFTRKQVLCIGAAAIFLYLVITLFI